MSDNEFEPYKVPALGKAIARVFVTVFAAFKPVWRPTFGWLAPPDIAKQSYLNLVNRYVLFLAPFWLVGLAVVSITLYSLFEDHFRTSALEAQDLRWRYVSITALLAAFGALIAVPFSLVRVYINERQAKTAEEGLITDRITKAIEQLGTEKTVKRQRANRKGKLVYEKDQDGKIDFDRPVNDEYTEPNLEVRLGAIYALERIAQDSERDHIPIMETLCAYVRENSKAKPAEDFPEPEWVGLEDYSDKAVREAHLERRRQRFGRRASLSMAWKWAQSLAAPRADIQAALKVIGRRDIDRLSYEKTKSFRLDLRAANLQGADLSDLRLGPALLTQARLEGADLSEAKMEGADLHGAEMEGANFRGTEMEGADLRRAKMEGADLHGAEMEGADLRRAKMEGADLHGAKMEGANLNGAKMEGAVLSGAKMEGADLRWASLKSADLANCTFARMFARSADFTEAKNMDQSQANALFGDTDTKLPNGLRRTTELTHAPLGDRALRDRRGDPEFERWKATGYPLGVPLDDP